MPQPVLALIVGLPGTGKTTLTAAVARELRWPVLDKDVLSDVLLDERIEPSEAGRLAYKLMFALTNELLVKQRQSVIVETAGRQPFILDGARTIAKRGQAQLKIVRCVAPAAVRAERLAGRVAEPSQWTHDQATDDDQRRWYAHLPTDTFVVLTQRPLAETSAEVLAFLDFIG